MLKKAYSCFVLSAIWVGLLSATVTVDRVFAQDGSSEAMEIMEAYLEEGNHADKLTLVILMERSTKPEIFSMEEPVRLVVDIPDAYGHTMLPNRIVPNDSFLSTGIRVGEDGDKRRVRFVFDLQPGKRYNVTPRLYLPESNRSGAKLLVTVTSSEPDKE